MKCKYATEKDSCKDANEERREAHRLNLCVLSLVVARGRTRENKKGARIAHDVSEFNALRTCCLQNVSPCGAVFLVVEQDTMSVSFTSRRAVRSLAARNVDWYVYCWNAMNISGRNMVIRGAVDLRFSREKCRTCEIVSFLYLGVESANGDESTMMLLFPPISPLLTPSTPSI